MGIKVSKRKSLRQPLLQSSSVGYVLVAQQGRVFEVKDKRTTKSVVRSQSGGVANRCIRVFSRKSRNRLIELFARLEPSGTKAKFVTLTFANLPTQQEAYAALRRFLERLRRKHPDVSLVWRKEYQSRGSIHYHLVVFNMPYYPQRQLQNVWTDCTGEHRSIVDVRSLHTHTAVMRYVSKYVAKIDDREVSSLEEGPKPHAAQGASCGRFWGVHNRGLLPFALVQEFVIKGRDHVRYIATMMQRYEPRCTRGYNLSRKVYSKDAHAMYRWAWELEKPLSYPFVRLPRGERHYTDSQRTVSVPCMPLPPSRGYEKRVGELVLESLSNTSHARTCALAARLVL